MIPHTIRRRNRRHEWIIRNRLHPQHGVLTATLTPVLGPTGLWRKNPRNIGAIHSNGIKRINRLSPYGKALMNSASTVAKQAPQRALYRVEQPQAFIVVVADMVAGRLTDHDRDVLGLAQQMAAQQDQSVAVVGVVFGESKEEFFAHAGIDRLIHCSGEAFHGYCPEQILATLQAVESELSPLYWLFPDSIAAGAERGRRLAAYLGQRPAAGVWQVSQQHVISRSASGQCDYRRDIARILLLAEECASPVEDTRHEVLPVDIPLFQQGISRIRDGGSVAVDAQHIPLSEAEFILSAGNGVYDWQQFHHLSALLGATEGASRVAVDDGFMPRERQVGATGTWVSARVYFAVGISGAIQHMQGIGQCDKVITINTEPGCEMVKRADLAVIGDSGEILGELEKLLTHQHSAQEVDNAA